MAGLCVGDLFKVKPSCVLMVAAGGGGDVVSAAAISLQIKLYSGVQAVVATPIWERFTRDPLPGPMRLDDLAGAELLSYAALLKPDCTALRGGRLVKPSACTVAGAIPELPVYAVDLLGGTYSAWRGLEEVSSLHGCDAVVVLDVGGDVLAQGCEENLWSPLADSLVLSAASVLGVEDRVVAVFSPGSDGELDARSVLKRISAVASRGGLRMALSMGRVAYEAAKTAIARGAATEASLIPLLALEGEYGLKLIRGGTRSVEITPVSALAFFMDIEQVYELNRMAELVSRTSSIDEANAALNDVGVYTEYDLEKDVHLFMSVFGRQPELSELLEIRRRGKARLGPCRLVAHTLR
ncbi:MAG: DUF1152 domain-containing protein [Thermoproteota archaeon]